MYHLLSHCLNLLQSVLAFYRRGRNIGFVFEFLRILQQSCYGIMPEQIGLKKDMSFIYY